MSKNIQLGRFNTVDSPETVLLNKQKLQVSNDVYILRLANSCMSQYYPLTLSKMDRSNCDRPTHI